MESNGQDCGESPGTGVMVSNLPLLFTRGFPSSLHHMKLDELEDFVPFMVRCSLGEENPVPWSQLPRPTWWPRKLPFRIPSGSTPGTKRTALVGLVERCYSFHGCEYLLQFCANLLESMPPSGYRFNDNRDGTTSMYHGTTGKLLVTFRNENRDYDKSSHDQNLRKKLLLSPTRVSTSGTTTAVFQPAATDIYLCDKCENEFDSLREVQIHEKKCCGDAPPSPVPLSPEPEPVEEEPEPAGQVPFLAYFKLQPAKHTGLEPYMSPRKRSSSPPRKLIGPMFPRFESIALTSPLGRFLLANSKLRNKYQASQHLVIRYERHLHATPHTDIISSRERCNNRWIVVWRPNKEEQPWSHLYCFTKANRRDRRIAIKTGLNLRSRRLAALCRPLKVAVKRLQKRVVDRVMRLNGPSAPCIDLTDEPQKQLADVLYPENLFPASMSQGMIFNGAQKSEDPLRLFYDSSEASSILAASLSSSSILAASLSSSSILAASSSSSQPSGIPALFKNRQLAVTPLPYKWSGETQSVERDPLEGRDPLELNPGDIICSDSISLLPLPSTSLGQNHTANSRVSLAAHHSKNPYPSDNFLPPGPKCSKIARQDRLPNKPSVQQNTGFMMSNQELIQLSQGNFDVLNRLSNSTNETSSKGQGGSGLNIARVGVEQNSNQSPRNAVKSSGIKSESGPRLQRNDNSVLLRNLGVDLTPIPLPSKHSSIEVIDLSSDEDDSGKFREHTSHQIDGLALYQHSSAGAPSSSKLSMPKNGNSHWSLNCKSHCEAGRVGDLATNGQPPNVLRSLASPVPSSLFLPPLPTQGFAAAVNEGNNPRKRRCEDPPLTGGVCRKLQILDVSSQGLQSVSQEEVVPGDDDRSVNYIQRNENRSTIKLLPLPREFGNSLHTPALSASFLGSNQSGAFLNDIVNQNSKKSVCECLSVVDQGRSLSEGSDESRGGSASLHKESCSRVLENYSKTDPQDTSANGGKFSSRGLLGNLVSTVSKGVEFIYSLVGSAGVSDPKPLPEDKLPSNSRDAVEFGNVRDDVAEDKSMHIGRSTQVPRKRELKILLQDECRELHLNGLDDLRLMDLKNVKLTRKSVERVLPNKAQRKRHVAGSKRGESSVDSDVGSESRFPQDHVSESEVTLSTSLNTRDDELSACIDENGNSPTYVKTKLRKGAYCDIYLDDKAKQSDYISQMENSNNNYYSSRNNNNNIDSTELPVSSRHGKLYTNHYRGSEDLVCANQTNLQHSDCVSIVNSGCVSVRDTINSESLGNIRHDACVSRYYGFDSKSTMKSNACEKELENVNLHSGKHKEREQDVNLACEKISLTHQSTTGGVLLSTNCGVELLEASSQGGSMDIKTRRALHVKKSPFSCSQTSIELTVNSKNVDEILYPHHDIVCATTVTGKTAEEGGALQARVPSPDGLHHIKLTQPLTCTKPSSLLNANTSHERSEHCTSCGGVFSCSRKIGPHSSSSQVYLQKVGSFSMNLSSEKVMEKGFQSSSGMNSGVELDYLSNGTLSVMKNTKDVKRRTLANVRALDKTDDKLLLNFLPKSKKKASDLLKRDLASLDDDEWGTNSHNGGLLHVDDINDDIENMPLHGRIHEKAREKRPRLSFTPNNEVMVQTSTSSGRSSSSTLSIDSVYRAEKRSIRDGGASHSRNVDDHDRIHCEDRMDLSTSKQDMGKRSLLRELSNLGKDDWKDTHKSGFHPVDLVGKRAHPGEESDNEAESDSIDSEPLSRRRLDLKASMSMLQQKKYRESDVKANQCNTKFCKKSTLSRELRSLGKDEWKEARGTGFHPSSLIPLDSNHGHLYTDDFEEEDHDDQYQEREERSKPSILSPRSMLNKVDDESECAKKKKKKPSMPRELLNLGKDEWKEMKNTGFHPSDLVGSKNDCETYFFGESDDEDSIENEPPPKVKPSSIQRNKKKEIREKLPLELARLLKDECKELKRKNGSSAKTSLKLRWQSNATDGREKHSRREEKFFSSLMLSDQYATSVLKSVNMFNEFRSQRDIQANRGANARNTRSQTNVVSLVEVLTPRDSHRQLLHTETAMCVLNFNLPMIS